MSLRPFLLYICVQWFLWPTIVNHTADGCQHEFCLVRNSKTKGTKEGKKATKLNDHGNSIYFTHHAEAQWTRRRSFNTCRNKIMYLPIG